MMPDLFDWLTDPGIAMKMLKYDRAAKKAGQEAEKYRKLAEAKRAEETKKAEQEAEKYRKLAEAKRTEETKKQNRTYFVFHNEDVKNRTRGQSTNNDGNRNITIDYIDGVVKIPYKPKLMLETDDIFINSNEILDIKEFDFCNMDCKLTIVGLKSLDCFFSKAAWAGFS